MCSSLPDKFSADFVLVCSYSLGSLVFRACICWFLIGFAYNLQHLIAISLCLCLQNIHKVLYISSRKLFQLENCLLVEHWYCSLIRILLPLQILDGGVKLQELLITHQCSFNVSLFPRIDVLEFTCFGHLPVYTKYLTHLHT